jgi:MFS family permease
LRIALPLYVYAHTGSVASTGLTLVASTLPSLVVAPVAGVLVDRWDRRTTMIVADIARAAVLLLLLGEPDRHAIWIVVPVSAAQASLSQFFTPARSAAIPGLVAPDRLAAANSALAAGSQLALLGGPALGGLVYALAGLRLSVGLDVASYLLSAATVAVMRAPGLRRPDRTTAPHPASAGRVLAELGDGLRVAGRNTTLRALVPTTVVTFAGGGLLAVLIVPFARGPLRASGLHYGLVLSAQAVGGLAGTLVATRVIRRSASPRLPMATSLFLIAAAVAGLGVAGRWWVAALCLAGGGVPTTVAGVVTHTAIQTEPSTEYRGRIAGLHAMTVAAGAVVGNACAGRLAGVAGHRMSMMSVAALFGAAGVIAAVALPTGARPAGAARRRAPATPAHHSGSPGRTSRTAIAEPGPRPDRPDRRHG